LATTKLPHCSSAEGLETCGVQEMRRAADLAGLAGRPGRNVLGDDLGDQGRRGVQPRPSSDSVDGRELLRLVDDRDDRVRMIPVGHPVEDRVDDRGEAAAQLVLAMPAEMPDLAVGDPLQRVEVGGCHLDPDGRAAGDRAGAGRRADCAHGGRGYSIGVRPPCPVAGIVRHGKRAGHREASVRLGLCLVSPVRLHAERLEARHHGGIDVAEYVHMVGHRLLQ